MMTDVMVFTFDRILLEWSEWSNRGGWGRQYV